MKDAYINAVSYDKECNVFSRMASFFFSDPDTDTGLGVHYIIDLIGTTDMIRIVTVVCENHDIPIYDFRFHPTAPIRDIVAEIMEKSPPRCAIVLDMRDNELMQKVRARIAGKQCDLRYRRVIFCLTDAESAGTRCLHIPGSTNDKMTMLLYYIPAYLREQTESVDCFRTLAESMTDYSLFEPRVWRNVCIDGTLAEFLSTARYQLVRRVRTDPALGDAYPSFELDWRRLFATRLNRVLSPPPVALCPGIHRVIPIGVSQRDALQAMTVAIPKDLQDPYAITVQTPAIEDKCGSIVITQPMRLTVIHVNCLIDPGILVDVCRELRTGYRSVVSEVHAMNTQLVDMKEKHDKTTKQLSTMRVETNTRLTIIQHEMAMLVTRLLGTGSESPPNRCTKHGCSKIVTKRFQSGKRQKQCATCVSHVVRTTAKRKIHQA